MAHKIINKFKEPKYAEFSRKDLVIDIKNGILYYKSNLGVHRISSGLSTDTFGSGDVTNITQYNIGIPDTFKNDGIRVGDSSITGTLTITENNITTGDTTIGGNTTITGNIIVGQSASFGNVVPNPGLNINALLPALSSNTTASSNQIIGPASFFEAGDLVNISTGSYNQTVRVEDINTPFSMSINTSWAGPSTGSFIYNVDPDLFVVKASDGKTELKLDNRGNLDVEGNISASGGLFISSSNEVTSDILFYNTTTGKISHGTSPSTFTSTGISGSFTAVSASIAADLNLLTGVTNFKNTGQRDGDSSITGSLILSGSGTPELNVLGNISASNGLITNNLVVGGTITAQEFHTEFVSSSIIFTSGSTQFGNSSDDIHTFSGSIHVKDEGHITASGNISSSGTIYANDFQSAGGGC